MCLFYVDVPLDVFLSFNKMKEIASGVDEIQKALESSEMLELSSDRQSVRRITEIKRKDNIDECTVYVVRNQIFKLLPKNIRIISFRNAYHQMRRMKQSEINSSNLVMCHMFHCQSIEQVAESKNLHSLNSKIRMALRSV